MRTISKDAQENLKDESVIHSDKDMAPGPTVPTILTEVNNSVVSLKSDTVVDDIVYTDKGNVEVNLVSMTEFPVESVNVPCLESVVVQMDVVE